MPLAISSTLTTWATPQGFGDTTTFAGETGFLQLGNQGVIERRLGTMNINNQEQISYSLWQPTPVTPLMYQDDDYAR